MDNTLAQLLNRFYELAMEGQVKDKRIADLEAKIAKLEGPTQAKKAE